VDNARDVPLAPSVSESITILHLSDLHLGAGELREEDAKTTIPKADRRKFVERLGEYLRALSQPPHLVCVTGDITNRGDRDGFADFLTWVEPLIDGGFLPQQERFLITAGNHDVKRMAKDEQDRFADFYRLARAFPHAYVPGHDPVLPTVPQFDRTCAVSGGITTRQAFGKVDVLSSAPYLYDRDARLFVFAFNSSLACGVYPSESTAILNEIDRALELADAGSPLKRKLEELRARAANDLLVDAGLVGDEQLQYFERLMRTVRSALGKDWRQVTKVALLHHHVNPIWRQQLELKPFEMIIDAAQVKETLTEFGFDVVLHGHKHQNGVSVDTTVVPASDGRSHDPIGIVSGGTVCGYPALNDHQTFKILMLNRAGLRESAAIEEYPLSKTGDPEEAMRVERRLYRLPLAERAADLHDDTSLKALLDEKLLDKAITDMPSLAVRMDGGQTFLLGDSDLVTEHGRYRFASMVESSGTKTFIEIILATARLDFRQRARIHWMLVDVKELGAATSTKPNIRLVIGNLANTHFSREREADEIKKSIDELRACFAPALRSELLDIEECKLSQTDIEQLDREIPAASRQN